jgi:hypothetical protein
MRCAGLHCLGGRLIAQREAARAELNGWLASLGNAQQFWLPRKTTFRR